MSFIKKNLNLIGRLLVNHFAIAIFSFVLVAAAITLWGVGGSSTAMLVISIVSVLFYGYLVYVCQWEKGSQDIVRMEAGRLPFSKTVGLRAGLVASIPNAVLFLLLTVGMILDLSIGNSNVFAVASVGAWTWGSMYFGAAWSLAAVPNPAAEDSVLLQSWIVVICYGVSLFVLPLVSHLAYRMGQKNKFSAVPGGKKKS